MTCTRADCPMCLGTQCNACVLMVRRGEEVDRCRHDALERHAPISPTTTQRATKEERPTRPTKPLDRWVGLAEDLLRGRVEIDLAFADDRLTDEVGRFIELVARVVRAKHRVVFVVDFEPSRIVVKVE